MELHGRINFFETHCAAGSANDVELKFRRKGRKKTDQRKTNKQI